MAQSLKLNTTAEGVENIEQPEWVRCLDCDQAQGYLIAKALPVTEVMPFLEAMQRLGGLKRAATPAPGAHRIEVLRR